MAISNKDLVPQTRNNCEISIEDKLLLARRGIAELAGLIQYVATPQSVI